jgi:hypothetical protein
VTGAVPAPRIVDLRTVNGMETVIALLLCAATISGVLLLLRRLARPRRRMYAAISARCADIQARSAAAYTTPVPDPSVDGPTAGAGTPDPAPAVEPLRVRMSYRGQHRAA